MNIQEFFNKWNSKKTSLGGLSECVACFRQFCQDVLEISQPKGVNHAKDFWNNFNTDNVLVSNFTKIANTPSFVPQVGDIAIWSRDTSGHIAVCTGKGTTSEFEVFHQNVPVGSPCIFGIQTYKEFYGVLRPKNQSKFTTSKYKTGDTVTCSTRYKEPTNDTSRVQHLSPNKSGVIAFVQGNWYLIQFNDGQYWCNEGDIRGLGNVNLVKNTVGQKKVFRIPVKIYQNSNLTGTKYDYKANTTVTIQRNVDASVDEVKVIVTGRRGYVSNKVYK